MADILDLIDNALADYETSGDAMRWTPDQPTGPAGETWWVAGQPITFRNAQVTFTLVGDPYYPAPEMSDADAVDIGQQIAAQICAVFGVPPEVVGVRLCGKHWQEYRRLAAEQAAKRVRLRRMHSAYHARKR